jgi:AcrR family transcriptional regulator
LLFSHSVQKKKEEEIKLPGQTQRSERIVQGEERSKRQERAHRILDAAGELVQRWGYKKTTIDDIAKQAKVAKGTIYLHWKNREDLFMALFLREALDAGYEMFERMKEDPEGFLLRNQTKHSIYVTMSRPLIMALYLGDADMLGELIHSDHHVLSLLMRSKAVASEEFFELMRNKGVVRTNMSISQQMYTYTAIIMGFMTVERYLPEHLLQRYAISLEESVDALARTIRCTFEPDELIPASTVQEVKTIFTQFYEQYLAVVKEQLQKEMDL